MQKNFNNESSWVRVYFVNQLGLIYFVYNLVEILVLVYFVY